MSAANPRHYRYYPQEQIDLGTLPFEGDWTPSDRIAQPAPDGLYNFYTYSQPTNEFGRYVIQKVGGRVRQVWQAGVTIGPIYWEIDGQQVQAPVWFSYCGDGVCAVKLPNGDQPEPYVPEES